MRFVPPKLQATLTVAVSLVAAPALTLLASGAFAHAGADGGVHHERVNMAQHLNNLEAWLATLSPATWLVLPMLLALCVWQTVRWLHRKSKHTSSARNTASHKDAP